MKTDPDLLTDFDLFWQAYPRKVGKKRAKQAWDRLKPDTATVQKMLDALAWQVKQPQWVKDGGMYVPHPTTWLHEERWDDEPFFTTEQPRDKFSGLRDFIDG